MGKSWREHGSGRGKYPRKSDHRSGGYGHGHGGGGGRRGDDRQWMEVNGEEIEVCPSHEYPGDFGYYGDEIRARGRGRKW